MLKVHSVQDCIGTRCSRQTEGSGYSPLCSTSGATSGVLFLFLGTSVWDTLYLENEVPWSAVRAGQAAEAYGDPVEAEGAKLDN